MYDSFTNPDISSTNADNPLVSCLRGSITQVEEIDCYIFQAPEGTRHGITIQLITEGFSCLMARMSILDSEQQLLASTTATEPHANLEIHLGSVQPNDQYFVQIDAGNMDRFCGGEYELRIYFDPQLVPEETEHGIVLNKLEMTQKTIYPHKSIEQVSTLQIEDTQLFCFSLSVDPTTPQKAGLTLSIRDADNNLLAFQSVEGLEPSSLNVLLIPGSYTLRLTGHWPNNKPTPLHYVLLTTSLSDALSLSSVQSGI